MFEIALNCALRFIVNYIMSSGDGSAEKSHKTPLMHKNVS